VKAHASCIGRPLAIAITAAIVVSGCVDTSGRPATDPRYARAVRDFYNANAAEPGCDAPQIVVLQSLQTTGSALGVLRMAARFDYEQRDRQTMELICQGRGERFFSVLQQDRGPIIVQGMSGSRRPRA